MPTLYPLRFHPLFRRYLWGGRRLETVLGKKLADGNDYAESWELVDHRDDQSVVAHGHLQGTTLQELVAQHGKELLGRHDPQTQFPLLFKFLDAQRDLSVQVHPDDEKGAQLDPPDLGKTEAWVILHVEPGSLVYAGLKRGFDAAALKREVNRGTAELCLHRFEPRAGDCVFIPAGVVHALGAGLVVAEIQQASDTTFRLFDWNRLGPDGQPRALHVEQALDAIDYEIGPISPQQPQLTQSEHISRLVACDKFVLDRWKFTTPQELGGDQRGHLLVVLQGELAVAGDLSDAPLSLGETIFLPAVLGTVRLVPRGEVCLLDIYLP